MNDQQQTSTVEPEILPAVTIDLDTLEREGDEPPPFTFRHEGRCYTLTNPRDVDWQDIIAALTNPFLFFQATMSKADQELFLGTKMAAHKLNHLIEKYCDHFGLPKMGESGALPH